MSTADRVHVVGTPEKPANQRFQFGPWTLVSRKTHILESEGVVKTRFESQLELPQLPEMVFAESILRVEHQDGFGVEFNALDALKQVDPHHDPLKVAAAQAWRAARSDCEHMKEVVKPFDWTYTTDYKGSLFGKEEDQLKVTSTDQRIDMEKLKVREKIHFYEDIVLFEDELADNGTSELRVKVRVMPTSFFVLLRFFMRVDNVMIRIIDTRLYHEAGTNFILRESCCRDNKISEIKTVPLHILTVPNEVAEHLTIRKETFEKLEFPDTSPQPDAVS